MAITTRERYREVKNITGIAANGGTAQYQFTTAVDTVVKIKATVLLVYSTASHIAGGAALEAEYIVENRNGVINVPAALTNSSNPMNSNTASLPAGRSEASDVNSGGGVQPTAVWSNSGTLNLTITNNFTAVVDALVFIDAYIASNL